MKEWSIILLFGMCLSLLVGCKSGEEKALTDDQFKNVIRLNSDISNISAAAREVARSGGGGARIPNQVLAMDSTTGSAFELLEKAGVLSQTGLSLESSKLTKLKSSFKNLCESFSRVPNGVEEKMPIQGTSVMLLSHKNSAAECPLLLTEKVYYNGQRGVGVRGTIRNQLLVVATESSNNINSQIQSAEIEYKMKVLKSGGESTVQGGGSGVLMSDEYGEVTKEVSISSVARRAGASLQLSVSYKFSRFTAIGRMSVLFDKQGRLRGAPAFEINGEGVDQETYLSAFSLSSPLAIPEELLVIAD